MRNLTAHIVPGDTGAHPITADARDLNAGNTSHEYTIEIVPDGLTAVVWFQHGPVGTSGANGIQDSDLLSILIDRFEGFQAGPFACEANALVLASLQAALDANLQRTRDRVARGVEGQNKA